VRFIQYFYIVDSDVYLSSTHRTNSCFSIAKVVAWTRHSVTLYGHFLSCWVV